jgi:hypothetical protein
VTRTQITPNLRRTRGDKTKRRSKRIQNKDVEEKAKNVSNQEKENIKKVNRRRKFCKIEENN